MQGCQIKSLIIFFLTSQILLSCGYRFQSTQNPLYYQKGIEKIYIQSIKNNSTTLGIENTILRSMIQELESQKKVKIVSRPEQADAYLTVSIDQAQYIGTDISNIQSITAPGVDPAGIPDNVYIHTKYTASLSCSFRLTDPTSNQTLWSTSLSRSRFFPANNRLGALGTTSALINESEFIRSITDLSVSMMAELSEHMLGLF